MPRPVDRYHPIHIGGYCRLAENGMISALFRILNRISFACRFHLMFVVVFRTSVIMNGSEVRTEYKASPVISSLDPVFDLIFSYMKNIK